MVHLNRLVLAFAAFPIIIGLYLSFHQSVRLISMAQNVQCHVVTVLEVKRVTI